MKNSVIVGFSLVCLIIAVGAIPHSERRGGGGGSSSKVKITMKQCLVEHNIDPAVLEPDNRDDDPHDSLSDEKKGCVTACVYRAFNWLRPDGTFDIDLLTEGETPQESEAEKKKYLKIIEECRNEVGKDDCKFFRCLDLKDL